MHNDDIIEPQQYPQFILGNANKRIGHVHAANADENKTLEYGRRNDTLGYSSLEQDDSSESIDDDDSGDIWLIRNEINIETEDQASDRGPERTIRKRQLVTVESESISN